MNDNTSFERYISQAFDGEGTGRPVPDAIHDELITRARRQRQWPTWLASVKEPPMRLTNSNAVGSPTIRVVAIMAATFLLILALAVTGIAGKNLLAADGTIVVDPNGNGDFGTIGEAIAAAKDGDTVHVEPGRYAESVFIDKSITLRGEDAATTVIEVGLDCTVNENWEATCPAGTPIYNDYPFAIVSESVDVTIQDLGFVALTPGASIVAAGGTASIAGLSYLDGAEGGTNIAATEGADVSIADSDLASGWVGTDRTSRLAIEGSTVGQVSVESGSDIEPTIVRGNQILGAIWSTGATVIEGNRFTPVPGRVTTDSFILIGGGRGWVVRDNEIEGATGTYAALDIQGAAGPGTVEGNTFSDNEIAIVASNDSVIRNNTIKGGRIGLRISGGTPQLEGNTVEDMQDYGLNLAFSDAVLTDNRLCESTTDLFIGTGADPAVDDSNEICVTDSVE